MKVREVIRMIQKDGWYLEDTKGVIGSSSTPESSVE
jgi:hypothetical protein